MANVILKNLYKRFPNSATTINNFNLEVRDTELVAILGPSGSGKTTLLRLIAGLDEVSNGQIIIGNKVVNKVPPHKRDISMVFQDQSIYPHLNVYKNIFFALKSQKLSKQEIDVKIKRISQELGLGKLLYTKPSKLSKGQVQKVALARAMIRTPKLFLLDEPLGNLDSDLRFEIRNLILKTHRNLATAMIISTNNQEDAMAIATRIIVLKDGFIQQIDTPSDIYNNPKNLFVAKFLGYPKMNFIEGELRKVGDQVGISFKNNFISLDSSKRRLLTPYLGKTKKIVLGIRPEHIKIINVEHADLNGVFKSEILDIENLGSESYITVLAADVELKIKAPSNAPISIGDKVNIGLFLKKSHIFDGDTDEIISH